MRHYSSPPVIPPEIREAHGPQTFLPDLLAADVMLSHSYPRRTYEQLSSELTQEERTQMGFELLSSAMPTLTWAPRNSIVLCGPPASGKTTLAATLQRSLRYMRHQPTAAWMSKNYTVQEHLGNPLEEYLDTLESFAFARAKEALAMNEKLGRQTHSLSGGDIVIGGVLQSFVTLCAYCNTYTVDQTTGQLVIPDSLMNITLFLMTQWAPRAFVFVDAPKAIRHERAFAQGTLDSVEYEKRKIPFEHDDLLRELTISTLQRMHQFAQERGIPLNLLYYSTEPAWQKVPQQFQVVTSTEQLSRTIYQLQDHHAFAEYLQKMEAL